MDAPPISVSVKTIHSCATFPGEKKARSGSPTAKELHQMTGKYFPPAEFLSDNFIQFAHKHDLPVDYEYIFSNSSFAVPDGTHLKLSEGFALNNCVFVSGKLTFFHGHIWVAGPNTEVILKGNAKATATAAGAKIIVASKHAVAKTDVDDVEIINLTTGHDSHELPLPHYNPNPALIPSKIYQDRQRKQEIRLNRSQGGLTNSGGKVIAPETATAAPAAPAMPVLPAANTSFFETVMKDMVSIFHGWPK